MSRLHRCVFACLFALFALVAPRGWAQTSFTTAVVFGDSLSDTGNIAHLTQTQYGIRYPSDIQALGINYTDGRFTDGTDTQPAASRAYTGVWIEQVAGLFGTGVVVKDSLDGGTNYAYGDATTGAGVKVVSATYLGKTFTITLNNMGQQVSDYLATNPKPGAGTLYVLWGGSNDILDAASAGTDPVAAAGTAVANELALIRQLMAAGATNFMVPNVPPLGAIAAGSGAPPATVTALNTASFVFAQGLTAGITALKQAAMGATLNLYEPDVFTLLQGVAATPMAYGFGNLTTAAQGVAGSPDTYLIWDGLHPTTTGHHYVAATAANLLQPLAASTATLSAPAGSLAGQPVTVTATVTSAKTGDVPTGLVTLFDGTSVVGSGALDATGKVAVTFTPTEAAGGTVALEAVYAGDVINTHSAPATVTVPLLSAAVATTTTLVSSAATANLGASVTFTATVTPASSSYGAPEGTVTFLDGTTTLGTGTLSAGAATYTTSSLSAGAHSITAIYGAAGLFGGSTSAALTETVTAPGFTATASPMSLTVARGASGQVNLTTTPTGGYTGPITPTCGTLPAHFSCSFAMPASVAADGTQAYLLTIATNGATTMASAERGVQVKRVWMAGLLLPGILGLLGFGVRRRAVSVRLLSVGLGALVCAGVLGLSGCGGGGSNNAAAGSYTVPVVFTAAAASGGAAVASQTVNLAVTVQ